MSDNTNTTNSAEMCIRDSDEIDKAVKEAAEFEAQDKKRKEAIDARNDADSFVFQTQQALDVYKRQLSHMTKRLHCRRTESSRSEMEKS